MNTPFRLDLLISLPQHMKPVYTCVLHRLIGLRRKCRDCPYVQEYLDTDIPFLKTIGYRKVRR